MEREYCGKNGFYIINDPYTVEEDADGRSGLCVYLNCVSQLEKDETGHYRPVTPGHRHGMPDLNFHYSSRKADDEDPVIEDCYVHKPWDVGVKAFAFAILAGETNTRDVLIQGVEELLNQDGAPWGAVSADDEENLPEEEEEAITCRSS